MQYPASHLTPFPPAFTTQIVRKKLQRSPPASGIPFRMNTWVKTGGGGPHRFAPVFRIRLPRNPSSRLIDQYAQCFHAVTNPSPCKLFLFTFIQNTGGGGILRHANATEPYGYPGSAVQCVSPNPAPGFMSEPFEAHELKRRPPTKSEKRIPHTARKGREGFGMTIFWAGFAAR
jgi:hypothetical protein